MGRKPSVLNLTVEECEYLEMQPRELDFDSKMHNALLVCKQFFMQFDEDGHFIPWAEDKEIVHVLSYDAKPSIQAIVTIPEDLLLDGATGQSAETMTDQYT